MAKRKTVKRCHKRRQPKKKRQQRGGAVYKRTQPRTIDKIAQGVSMFLSGPAPSFASLGALLGKQVFKGIKDNVQHYRGKR